MGALTYVKTVTAIQWTGDNAKDVTALMGGDNFDPHGEGENDDDPTALASMRNDYEGGCWRPLTVGDWVVRDDAGKWHSERADRFAATYRHKAPWT